jgi:hypothetical protein
VPNLLVDVNSWRRSACYPRSTFYPLSDGPSTRNRRITYACFRTCSACSPRSQAPLCVYTLRPVSIRPEGTFARLRYSFGGDRPSQTTHQTLSPNRIHGCRLDAQTIQGGISRMPPDTPECAYQKLPPILRRIIQKSMPSYSKGSRGLFVLPRVARIFTRTPISLDL